MSSRTLLLVTMLSLFFPFCTSLFSLLFLLPPLTISWILISINYTSAFKLWDLISLNCVCYGNFGPLLLSKPIMFLWRKNEKRLEHTHNLRLISLVCFSSLQPNEPRLIHPQFHQSSWGQRLKEKGEGGAEKSCMSGWDFFALVLLGY